MAGLKKVVVQACKAEDHFFYLCYFYLQSPDEGLGMFLVVVVPHPRRPVARGREDQVIRNQDPATNDQFWI